MINIEIIGNLYREKCSGFFKTLLHLFLRFRLSILDFYQFEQKMFYEALIWQFSVAIEKLENESQHFHQLFFGQYK